MSEPLFIYLSYLRSLVDFLRARHLPVDRVLKAMEIGKDDLGDTSRLLPATVVPRAFAAAESATGDAAIGMRLGLNMRPSDLGIVGTLAMTCVSSGELFNLHQRFMRMVSSGNEPEYVVDAESAFLALRGPGMALQCRQSIDFDVVGWITLVRWLIRADFSPRRVELAYAEPADSRELQKHLNCPISFGSAETRVHFPARFLAQLLNHRSRVRNNLEDEARKQLFALHGTLRHPNPVIAQVRQFVAESLGHGLPQFDRVADAVTMSPLRLHTLFEVTGNDFDPLVDGLRRDLAERYLREKKLTMVDIGLLLGCSGQADFLATFQRWFECDPRSYRMQLKA